MADSKARGGKYKRSLKHLIVPANKEVLQTDGECQRACRAPYLN